MNWSHATSALIVVGGCLALVRANMKLTDRVSRLDSYVRMFNAMMHVDSGDYPPRLAREDGSRNTTGLKVGDMVRWRVPQAGYLLSVYGIAAEEYGVGVVICVQDIGLRVEFFRKPSHDGKGLYFNFAECGAAMEKIESPSDHSEGLLHTSGEAD